ncbi:hypothetical protein LIER_41334 [Lithospermum erythrorhizon]|uniref:Uncharacterized protein n=1 Tax=Lithospermum erythrorhizon TaxID=34254 RepID=A0AAV3RBP6_LITER
MAPPHPHFSSYFHLSPMDTPPSASSTPPPSPTTPRTDPDSTPNGTTASTKSDLNCLNATTKKSRPKNEKLKRIELVATASIISTGILIPQTPLLEQNHQYSNPVSTFSLSGIYPINFI